MANTLKLLIPPPIVALSCGLGMWGIASVWPAFILSFPYQSVVAYSLIAVGLTIDLVAVLAFRKARTTVTPLAPEKASSLVVDGLYRFTRNPMYLGMLFILTGIAALLGSPANVLILLAFVTYITEFQIKPEETRLEDIFGMEFQQYRQQVRRWL